MARPAYERVGAAFRKAYEEAGLRQEDIAAALDVDQGTVSKWARGLARIDLDYFPSIDELCHQPRGYLLWLAGYVEWIDPADVQAAIAVDPDLDEDGRTALTLLYRVLKSRAGQPAGKRERLASGHTS